MADPQGGYDEGAQVSMTLPPTKQYQGSPMLNLRSRTVEGLATLITSARGNPVLNAFFEASGFLAEPGTVPGSGSAGHQNASGFTGGVPASASPDITSAPSASSADLDRAEKAVADAGLTAPAPAAPAASGEQQNVAGAPHIGCEHGGKLAVKSGKKGKFHGCDAFPNCRFIAGDA